MKRFIAGVSLFLCLLGSVAVFAKTEASQTDVQKKNPMVTVYKDADAKSSVVEQVPPIHNNLVRIYLQGDWIKVGDTKNGQVGWVNRKEYHAALRAYYAPSASSVQTIVIQQNSTQDGNKSTSNIVAYKNGQKLSDKEAQALYAKMQKQQYAQARAMRQQFRQMEKMQRMMEMQFYQMDPFFYVNDTLDNSDAVPRSGWYPQQQGVTAKPAQPAQPQQDKNKK